MTFLGDIPVAHGIGGARDLPISLALAIAGGVAALTISFTVLAVAWRKPRYEADGAATTGLSPAWLSRLVDNRWLAGALRALGLALTAYTFWVLWFGPAELLNPVYGMFYVLLWVGLVPASLLFGPVWRAISPFRALAALLGKASGSDPETGFLPWPQRWGLWPGALGLYAFVWMELVNPHNDEIGGVRAWITTYAVLMVAGTIAYGGRFLASADPFEVYSSLVARLSIWGRRDGRPVIASPLANLAHTPAQPGLVAVVSVLFGSTAFDSFKDSTVWLKFIQSHSAPTLINNVALLASCLLVGLIFTAGTMATGTHADTRRADLPRLLAHSVVPIVVGYVAAHYATYFIAAGQVTLAQMSDPMATGANLFGTADWAPTYWLASTPRLLAILKVLAVVTGHVLGVVAAHDRAIALLPRRFQLTGQLPLLLAMVAFTAGGLALLFSA